MSELRRNKHPIEDGNLVFDDKAERMLYHKILEEISTFKAQFGVDEMVFGFDNSKGGYWRKDFWAGYKFKRAGQRDESDIDWESAFLSFEKLKGMLQNTGSKLIDIERVEGDDIIFVLSEYLAKLGNEVVIHSLDHDLVYCLRTPGVSYFRTQKTQKKAGAFVNLSEDEIYTMEMEHLIQGDRGDYIKNVKAYTKFSPEFIEKYPDKDPADAWKLRHQLDVMFMDKFGCSAYKHPPYGYKKFLKQNITVRELLDQNPIYEKNYELNQKIAMPDGIPTEYREKIIDNYNQEATKSLKVVQKFLTENRLFELSSIITRLKGSRALGKERNGKRKHRPKPRGPLY